MAARRERADRQLVAEKDCTLVEGNVNEG